MDSSVILEAAGIIAAILLGTWALLRNLRRDRKNELRERIEREINLVSMSNKLDILSRDLNEVRAQVSNHIPTRLGAMEDRLVLVESRLLAVEEKVDDLPQKE
jgi:hypothetical protein